jgi:hypothetical protein
MEPHQSQQLLPTILVTLLALVFVVRRTLTTQTMRVWALALIPALIIVLAIFSTAAQQFTRFARPFTFVDIIILVLSAAAGCVLGYFRGLHSEVKLGPRPGTIVVKGSLVLVIILVAAFAVRFLVRYIFSSDEQLGIVVSDAAIIFAAGSVAVGRGMLFVAYRRLLTSQTGTVSRTL